MPNVVACNEKGEPTHVSDAAMDATRAVVAEIRAETEAAEQAAERLYADARANPNPYVRRVLERVADVVNPGGPAFTIDPHPPIVDMGIMSAMQVPDEVDWTGEPPEPVEVDHNWESFLR